MSLFQNTVFYSSFRAIVPRFRGIVPRHFIPSFGVSVRPSLLGVVSVFRSVSPGRVHTVQSFTPSTPSPHRHTVRGSPHDNSSTTPSATRSEGDTLDSLTPWRQVHTLNSLTPSTPRHDHTTPHPTTPRQRQPVRVSRWAEGAHPGRASA